MQNMLVLSFAGDEKMIYPLEPDYVPVEYFWTLSPIIRNESSLLVP